MTSEPETPTIRSSEHTTTRNVTTGKPRKPIDLRVFAHTFSGNTYNYEPGKNTYHSGSAESDYQPVTYQDMGLNSGEGYHIKERLKEETLIKDGKKRNGKGGRQPITLSPNYEWLVDFLDTENIIEYGGDRRQAVEPIKRLYQTRVVRERLLHPRSTDLPFLGNRTFENLIEQAEKGQVNLENIWQLYRSVLLKAPLMLLIYHSASGWEGDISDNLSLEVALKKSRNRDSEVVQRIRDKKTRVFFAFSKDSMGEKDWNFVKTMVEEYATSACKETFDQIVDELFPLYIAQKLDGILAYAQTEDKDLAQKIDKTLENGKIPEIRIDVRFGPSNEGYVENKERYLRRKILKQS